jgi:hypothetical protein
MHACEQPVMQGGETGEKGEVDLEDIELDFDALRHAVVHRLDDGRDSTEGEMRRWSEPRVIVQFAGFDHKTHGDEAKEVFPCARLYSMTFFSSNSNAVPSANMFLFFLSSFFFKLRYT